MAKSKTKDIILYLVVLVLIAVSSFVGVTVNHYWHKLSYLIMPLAILFVVYDLTKARVSLDRTWLLKTAVVVFSVASLVFYGWWVGQKTEYADFSNNLVSLSDNTVYMVSSDKAEANDSAKVVVFLNPNCQACQYGVPKLYQELKKSGKLSQVDFVDVTVNRSYANSVGVEKTPTAYVKSGEYKGIQRFAYHTVSGENRLYQEQYDNIIKALE